MPQFGALGRVDDQLGCGGGPKGILGEEGVVGDDCIVVEGSDCVEGNVVNIGTRPTQPQSVPDAGLSLPTLEDEYGSVLANHFAEHDDLRDVVYPFPIVQYFLPGLDVVVGPLNDESVPVPRAYILPSDAPSVVELIFAGGEEYLVVCLEIHGNPLLDIVAVVILMEQGLNLEALIGGH